MKITRKTYNTQRWLLRKDEVFGRHVTFISPMTSEHDEIPEELV